MSIQSVKITCLNNIGGNISYTSIVPLVDMNGTPTTKKANLQILGNLILNGAGGSFFAAAAQAINAQTVSCAAQPAITSVGTLTGLTVSGVSNLGPVGNVSITGGSAGQVLSTNGSGLLSWASGSAGTSGFSGFSGINGTGTSGFSGFSGINGTGTSGFSGYSGAAGPGANTALTYCCTTNITSCSLTDHTAITTASNNFFAGTCAGASITSGGYNNFFGYYSGQDNTTGNYNNFIGAFSGQRNTTGSYNNFIGYNAGRCNTTGSYNNFFGYRASAYNTSGCANNSFGWDAGYCNTTGYSNNFFGFTAGRNNTTGCHNNFFGENAGRCNTTGNYNTIIGFQSGFRNNTGVHNIFAGACAGYCNTTGSNNLFFGCRAGVGAAGLANITTEANRIIMGNSSHTCAQIQIGWTTVSDIRDKCIFGSVPHGRGFLQNINPIEFSFKDRTTDQITDIKKRYGFSAQEILAVEGDNPVIASTENPDKLSLTTDYLIPILVNAIKELSSELDGLKLRVVELEKI